MGTMQKCTFHAQYNEPSTNNKKKHEKNNCRGKASGNELNCLAYKKLRAIAGYNGERAKTGHEVATKRTSGILIILLLNPLLFTRVYIECPA